MVDRIGVEVVSNWQQGMLHTKTNQQLFPRWRISMLTSSKVSSLRFNYAFYRAEHI